MASFFEADRDGWRYDFQLYGQRYRAPRGFRTKKLSDDAERVLRDRIRRQQAGMPDEAATAPSFTVWAGTTYNYAVTRRRLRDPATFYRTLKRILLFWGDKPSDQDHVRAGAPYHGLTLDAPIREGRWLLTFEEWMAAHNLAGSTRNHYRSACSRLYAVAMTPEYRSETGITLNPFRGIPRDPTVRRTSVLSKPQLRAVIGFATPAVRMAIGIALLAPELRLGNIAFLTWDQVQDDFAWIRIAEHKTAGHTGRPLATPIVPALKLALKAAHKLSANGYVIPDIGQDRVRRIQNGFQMAVTAAGLTYGTGVGQVSFHTLRHTAATVMAELGIPDAQRRDAIGHLALQTTQRYTHLSPHHKVEPLRLLADSLASTLKTPRKARTA